MDRIDGRDVDFQSMYMMEMKAHKRTLHDFNFFLYLLKKDATRKEELILKELADLNVCIKELEEAEEGE
ncbi:MAG: hypothetical protein OET79_13000 [Nitrospirota bacterium]|nr:hypothetical protein [Nitrospirota bacterium]